MSWVVDSSGWIEYFSEGKHAEKYSSLITGREKVFVPSLVLFEVYRKLKKVAGEQNALLANAQMNKCEVIELESSLAIYAADLSLQYKLGMADAIVYASALSCKARLATSDNDFRGLPQVMII